MFIIGLTGNGLYNLISNVRAGSGAAAPERSRFPPGSDRRAKGPTPATALTSKEFNEDFVCLDCDGGAGPNQYCFIELHVVHATTTRARKMFTKIYIYIAHAQYYDSGVASPATSILLFMVYHIRSDYRI